MLELCRPRPDHFAQPNAIGQPFRHCCVAIALGHGDSGHTCGEGRIFMPAAGCDIHGWR